MRHYDEKGRLIGEDSAPDTMPYTPSQDSAAQNGSITLSSVYPESSDGLTAAGTGALPAAPVIGDEQVKEFLRILQEYKAAKAPTERRVVAAEQWWKLRNTEREQLKTEIGKDGGFVSKSGWLHNVITSKHADIVEAYPEPKFLPREQQDKAEAERLSTIVPCIMEQNEFEETYSEAGWAKTKFGTPVYKVIWDSSKLGGLGDISIEPVSLLNVFWEPGVKNIQKGRYFFHTELRDNDELEQQFPQLKDKLQANTFLSTKFLYDDTVKTDGKSTVVDVYYHRGGKLHYCQFVAGIILAATENDVQTAQRGLYDHGLFPFVFDPLFPIEGSPCGYGYIDLCANPQTAVDILDTAFIKNAIAGAIPRYLSRSDGNINEQELLDMSKPVVHVAGNVDEASVRQITFTPMSGTTINVRDAKINELRQTSGNTETSTGNTTSGVTAAAAIAALQEASGKGSRDSTRASYRAYRKIVNMVVELVRQFYDLPRQFRITGEQGQEQFVTYDNAGLKPQQQSAFGMDMGYRLPVFDIKIEAAKKSAYSAIAQNELAMGFYKAGFFNPQQAEQALICLDMMDFDGKQALMQKISKNALMQQALLQFMQMAVQFSAQINPQLAMQVQMQAQQVLQSLGITAPMQPAQSAGQPLQSADESTHMQNARARARGASQPGV